MRGIAVLIRCLDDLGCATNTNTVKSRPTAPLLPGTGARGLGHAKDPPTVISRYRRDGELGTGLRFPILRQGAQVQVRFHYEGPWLWPGGTHGREAPKCAPAFLA